MATTGASKHTGFTTSGNTRDVKVERIGRVTVYRRGKAYSLYYRETGKSVRRKVDGNLAVARATASRVNASLEEGSPSPFGFTRVTVEEVVPLFTSHAEEVQGLALRTVDRYRAALEHFRRFVRSQPRVLTADQVTQATVDDFVKWFRRLPRARNGAATGKEGRYTPAGIRFVLCVCRTMFNWARKRRYLPPYTENPFSTFPIDKTFRAEGAPVRLFTGEERRAFFEASDDWQRSIFFVLAVYGLRVGELTHLLVSDVELGEGILHVRSKPVLFWSVKTGRERLLPLIPEMTRLFRRLIGGRAEGFVFLNRKCAQGKVSLPERFDSPAAFAERLQTIAAEARAAGATSEKAVRRRVAAFLRTIGQIPEKRIRQEFMKVAAKIGRSDVTRAHSLRHLFSTRAQELGVNPLLVQGLLGHTTLQMTEKYTHFSADVQREAIRRVVESDPTLKGLL